MMPEKVASRPESVCKLPPAGAAEQSFLSGAGSAAAKGSDAACSAIVGQRNHIPCGIGPTAPRPAYVVGLPLVKLARMRPVRNKGSAPTIPTLLGLAVATISYDLLDLRSMGNTHVPQRPVIEFPQGGDSLFDLALKLLAAVAVPSDDAV